VFLNLENVEHYTAPYVVTRAENTPSAAAVEINITQQNPTLKLVTTQFEMNAKHSLR